VCMVMHVCGCMHGFVWCEICVCVVASTVQFVCAVVCVCGECGIRYICVCCDKYSTVCVCVVVCVTHKDNSTHSGRLSDD